MIYVMQDMCGDGNKKYTIRIWEIQFWKAEKYMFREMLRNQMWFMWCKVCDDGGKIQAYKKYTIRIWEIQV